MPLTLVTEPSNVYVLADYRPPTCEPPVVHVFEHGPGSRCACGAEYWAPDEVVPGVLAPRPVA